MNYTNIANRIVPTGNSMIDHIQTTALAALEHLAELGTVVDDPDLDNPVPLRLTPSVGRITDVVDSTLGSSDVLAAFTETVISDIMSAVLGDLRSQIAPTSVYRYLKIDWNSTVSSIDSYAEKLIEFIGDNPAKRVMFVSSELLTLLQLAEKIGFQRLTPMADLSGGLTIAGKIDDIMVICDLYEPHATAILYDKSDVTINVNWLCKVDDVNNPDPVFTSNIKVNLNDNHLASKISFN